jgi:hypothetical protein
MVYSYSRRLWTSPAPPLPSNCCFIVNYNAQRVDLDKKDIIFIASYLKHCSLDVKSLYTCYVIISVDTGTYVLWSFICRGWSTHVTVLYRIRQAHTLHILISNELYKHTWLLYSILRGKKQHIWRVTYLKQEAAVIMAVIVW